MNHIETLRQYNEWRRHDSDTDDPPAMPNPTEIGLAIDWAIGELTHRTTTDNTAVIRQLEREVDLLRDKYRTEQSLRAQEERGRIEAQTQLEHIRRGADMYGVMQSMALQGKKHPKEPPMDGRLDAIRSLAAHNAKLAAELAEMQRLYERATRQAMEAERLAEQWEQKFWEMESKFSRMADKLEELE